MPEHAAPQSRNEAILQNILGEHNELLDPQSRNEAILQAILYGDSYTEDAQSRIEELLLCILNGTTTDLEPLSRNEEILITKINGGTYDKEPQSRIEELLIEWLNYWVEKTISGAVCSFDDAVPGEELISITSEIVPQQAGSGDPSPSNPRAISGFSSGTITQTGKNLFNGTDVLNAYVSTTIVANANTRTCYCRCTPNTTYTVSKTAGQRFGVAYTKELPANGVTVYGAVAHNTDASITFTTGADAVYLVVYVYHGSFDSGTADAMVASVQIEVGSTATAYEAYNATTQTVQFNQTVNGGTWKASQGKMENTWCDDIVDLGDLTWYGNGTGYAQASLSDIKPNPNSSSLSNIICNKLKTATQSQVYNRSIDNSISGATTAQVQIYSSSFSGYTDAQIKSALVGYKIAYEKATPTEITVEPVSLMAREGVNNIFADTGDTTIKYKAKAV